MRLSQDTVFFLLTQKYPTRFLHRNENSSKLRRPVFYTGDNIMPERTVILRSEDLKDLDVNHTDGSSLIVCIGELPDYEIQSLSSIIIIETSITQDLLYNELQAIYDIFDDWDESLKDCCNGNASFQDLINCSEPVLFDPLRIVDIDFHYIAYSKLAIEMGVIESQSDGLDNMLLENVRSLTFDPSYAGLYQVREVFDYPLNSGRGAYINIFYKDEYKGRIIITPAENSYAKFKYYEAILQHFVAYAELFYAKYRSFSKSQIAVDSLRVMLSECVDGYEIAPKMWRFYFDKYGWSQKKRLILLQFNPDSKYDKNSYINFMGSEIEKVWRGCIYFDFSDHFLLLVNLDLFVNSDNPETDFFQSLAYFLRDNLLSAGVSRGFTEMEDLPAAFTQTEIALEIGRERDPMYWYFLFDNYVLDYILKNPLNQFQPNNICSNKLLRLKLYDEEKNTELYKTLHCYFNCRFNAVATAKRLYIHRSSFLGRLERIKEVANIDFDSDDELLYLIISFRILESQ